MNDKLAGWRKIAEEFGPLMVFFFLNARGAALFGQPESQSLFIATAGFMATLALAIGSVYWRGDRPNQMTLVSAGFVLIFGGLTLWLQNETFIKIKPTLVYTLFAGFLAVGLWRGQSYLEKLMGSMLPLDSTGWLILTRRWTFFFIFCAVLNELAWRNLTTDQWVSFKVFAFLPLTMVFVLFQLPMIQRHSTEELTPPKDKP
jgi:intracellular septation protein